MTVQHEADTQNKNVQLPSLENLSDAEYLERSQQFGDAWLAVIEGNEGSDELLPDSVREIIYERSAAYAAIPEDQRAVSLIESYRTISNEELSRRGLPPLETAPITAGLLADVGTEVVELRPGVPAIILKPDNNRELFGTNSDNFSTGALGRKPGSLPFVVLRDVRKNHPESFLESQRHETSHNIWAIARNQGFEDLSGTPEGNDRVALAAIKDEAISFATAGQKQFTHTDIFTDLTEAGMDDLRNKYVAIGLKYREIVYKIDSKSVILGIMRAGTIEELETHIDRLYAISESMPSRVPVHTSGVGVALKEVFDATPNGWGRW